MGVRNALSIALLAIVTGTVAAQGRDVVWNMSVQLTERDILRLAADLGVRTPARVVDNRLRCPLVSVSSQPVVEGNRVATTHLMMRLLRGPNCPPATSEPNTAISPAGVPIVIHNRGNWIANMFDGVNGDPAYGNPRRLVAWRIRDSDWTRDVSLGPDVTYEVAQTIVRAIRRRTLVEVRSAAEIANAGPPLISPEQITSVRRFSDQPAIRRSPELYGDMYQVMSSTGEDFTGLGGSGQMLQVKIRNGRVELHGWSMWMS